MIISINTRNKSLRIFLWFVLILYLLILAKLIIFKRSPWDIKDHFLHHYSWKLAKANMAHANFTLFATIKLYLNSHLRATYKISNLLGNLIGFIPPGVLLPLIFKKLRTAIRTIVLVFLFSLAFETFQLFSMLGVFDVDDLLLNTLGGAIGYLLFWLVKKWLTPNKAV
jgi:glycopeptide antibiotics resistance protein